jgi:hypothetical protein
VNPIRASGLLLLLALACRPSEGARLIAQWQSPDTTIRTGRITLPLTATWCPVRARLMLLGVSNDSGVGILVRTVSLVPGKYPVQDTTRSTVPAAVIGFRIANEQNFAALTADSGLVAITAVDGARLTGRFMAWLRAGNGPVLLHGEFGPVTAVPDTVRCESQVPSGPAHDSSVP